MWEERSLSSDCYSNGCSKDDSEFRIYKNNQQYMAYFIGRSDHLKEDCHSGTRTAVVELYINDTLNETNAYGGVDLYEAYSSFSVVKLRWTKF